MLYSLTIVKTPHSLIVFMFFLSKHSHRSFSSKEDLPSIKDGVTSTLNESDDMCNKVSKSFMCICLNWFVARYLREINQRHIEVYKRGEWYLLNNVSKKYQLFAKWRVSVNPESSPTDPPPVCFKNEFSCSILYPEKSKIWLWNSTARVQGEKLCVNFVEFVLKTQK